jgi:acetyl esterase
MYIHGGAWVLGDYEVFQRSVVELAHGADATVAFVNYSLAPEARYPIPIEECCAGARWLADNGRDIDIDPSQLAIVGESAGGAIAAAVVGLAGRRGGPRISVQVLHCPVTDLSKQSASMLEFAEGYFVSEKMIRWCRDHYQPNVTESLASPLLTPSEQLRSCPPTLVITAEYDPIRDEGEAYARKLMAAGVAVTATRYLGTIHAFMSLNPLKERLWHARRHFKHMARSGKRSLDRPREGSPCRCLAFHCDNAAECTISVEIPWPDQRRSGSLWIAELWQPATKRGVSGAWPNGRRNENPITN